MMIFEFSAEQEDLRAAVRKFAEARWSLDTARQAPGPDRGLWKQLVDQLGLVDVAVPEADGGAGGDAVDDVVVSEELGRALVCSPYFATVTLACNVILLAGDQDVRQDLLERIRSGATATVAVGEHDASWEPETVTTTAARRGDGWTVSGRARFVVDGATADHVLVAADTGSGIGLFAIDGAAAGLERTPVPTLDLTRPMADLRFDGVPAVPLGPIEQGREILGRARDRALVALAAEQVGAAARCLEIAVEYAKIRHQFGSPIGKFQAVQHRCADMLMDVESARVAAHHAAWTADEPEFGRSARLAKAWCSEAFARVAESALHVHGGIGYTWDHDVHLYLRCARASQHLLGDPAHHREMLSRQLGYVPS